MSNEEPIPTPEELATLQKFCRHPTVEVDKAIVFLKVGENQKLTCTLCRIELEVTIDWKAYVYEDGEEQPVSCCDCGDYILKKDQIKNSKYVEPGDHWHVQCMYPDF